MRIGYLLATTDKLQFSTKTAFEDVAYLQKSIAKFSKYFWKYFQDTK